MKIKKFVQIGGSALLLSGMLILPARAQGGGAGAATSSLSTAIKTVTDAMAMLADISTTAVNIAVTPFGIGFAMMIARHLLRHSAA